MQVTVNEFGALTARIEAFYPLSAVAGQGIMYGVVHWKTLLLGCSSLRKADEGCFQSRAYFRYAEHLSSRSDTLKRLLNPVLKNNLHIINMHCNQNSFVFGPTNENFRTRFIIVV